MTSSNYDTQSDRELAIGAANHDQRAFAALYDRHFAGIYDFAIRLLRDPDAAAGVAERTFAEANRSLGTGHAPESPKGWLYAIALGEATTGTAPSVDPAAEHRLPSFIEIDTVRMRNAQQLAQDGGLRKLVWEQAESLSPREYALLDMTARRDLSNEEVAESIGISADTANTTLSGLRDSFQKSFLTTFLLQRGREACPDLDGLLQRSTAPDTSPEVHEAVEAHAAACETCQATLAGQPAAADILGGFALVPAPAGLKEVIWGNVTAPAAAGAAPPPPPPVVPREEPSRNRWWIWALVAAMAVLGVIVAVVILVAGGDDNEDTTTVQNPDDVRSTSHDIDEPSEDNTIEMVWSRQDEVRAYSVDFTENAFTLPDEEGDLSGNATGTTSSALDPGDWYFHIRTQGTDGTWSDAEHIGPYPIEEPEASPTPAPTEEPTEAPTASPAPTAAPTPTPVPATPTPSPVPATPTPTP